MKNEIEELKKIVDQLLIFNAEATARNIVLRTMILDLYKKELSEPDFEKIIEYYREMLESESLLLIDELNQGLFDKTGLTALRAKQAIHEMSSHVRRRS